MRALLFPFFISLLLLASATIAKPDNLITKEIASNWSFHQIGGTNHGKATVPGTVHTDLLANGLIDDPFYRVNEKKLQWIDKSDWEYSTSFSLSTSETAKENQVLLFKGLDTYADVYLNDSLILKADNMFREWEIPVRKLVKAGNNNLRILFHSPINQGLKMLAKSPYPYPATNDQSENGGLGDKKVSIFTRKAGYHYGWDWGPRLVTSGIWRPIIFSAWDKARINNVFIKQPEVSKEKASLIASVTFSLNQPSSVEITVSDGTKKITSKILNASAGNNQVELPFSIEHPNLWWSNGLGKPNLYNFKTTLSINGNTVYQTETQTGIRSLKLIRKPDDKGETFYFELNGVPVFAKGANYIPNDNFLPRVTNQQYDKVVSDAVNANMNMLRIWGGGIYENDYFYQLCDKYGIMLWQDFMFACSLYPGDTAFLNNIAAEARDNIIRLRNHPSIALWCGNNEIDAAWQYDNEKGGWGWKQAYTQPQRDELQKAYLKVFHDILPNAVSNLTDGDPYWPSSPSSGPNPNQHAGYNTTSGDIHYWGVWHGLHKFDQFETNIGRFMSEYGFQSFPEFETVKKYTLPEDYSIESEVMASHQRSGIGNLRIKEYMGWDYNIPTDFEQFLYVGQLLQARGIKMAIETHRRAMPFCMGTLFWQINDCWPVASWSSTDYYHNWKAMHYMAKKAYMPVIVTIVEKNNEITLSAVSDRLEPIKGNLLIETIDFSGKKIKSITLPVTVNANAVTLLGKYKREELLNGANPNHVVLNAFIQSENKEVTSNLFYFVPPKDLKLDKPAINISVNGNGQQKTITLKSNTLVKDIMLYVPGLQLPFSENYFDLLPQKEYTIYVETPLSAAELKSKLKYRDLSL